MYKNYFKSLLSVVLFLALVSFNAYSEDAIKQVQIQTNAHCGGCKSKIEKGLNKLDGILKSDVNLENKVVTVSYNPSKINEEQITQKIADLGYSTTVKKDSECCEKGTTKDLSSKKDCGSKSNCCSSKTSNTKTTNNEDSQTK